MSSIDFYKSTKFIYIIDNLFVDFYAISFDIQ